MFVLGTCGHVDHGKSTFLRELTQMEPDRLPEEKKRGMTIDLNFVWFSDSKDRPVGIVDVPGHHRFVKNMISGAMMVDAFIFLLASDDGWMPQSEEHLCLLKGLGIHNGIGVLSKTDLVEPKRVVEVKADFERRLRESLGHSIPVCPFAPGDSRGLETIKNTLEKLLSSLPDPESEKRPRLWVDRVFVPKGYGPLVTGTLREGVLREGDEVFLLPQGKKSVVKGLQCYQKSVYEAYPTSRVALQLSRIQRFEVERGSLVVLGSSAPVAAQVDVSVSFLTEVAQKNVRCSFQLGTLKEKALLIPFIDNEDGKPADEPADENEKKNMERLCRIKFSTSIPVRHGDRFVLRSSGEEKTLATGVVIDPCAVVKSHREALKLLKSYFPGAEGLVRYELLRRGYVSVSELSERSIYSGQALLGAIHKQDALVEYQKDCFADRETLKKLEVSFQHLMVEYQRENRKGISPNELFKAITDTLQVDKELVSGYLGKMVLKGSVRKEGGGVVWAEFKLVLDPMEKTKRAKLMALISEAGGEPVPLKDLPADLEKSLWAMVKDKDIHSLGQDHFVGSESFDRYRKIVCSHLKEKGQATTSELRQILGISRKNAIFILEKLDQERVTFLKDGVRKLLGSY